MSFDSPYVADEEFMLSRRFSSGQYTTAPYIHPRAPSTRQKGFQVDSKRHFGSVAHISPAGTGSSPHSPPVLSADLPQTESDLILTDLLGQGSAGHVFLGTAEDGSPFAVKVATLKEGKVMLSSEASIYDNLSELQGDCVPEMFGLFRCEHFDVLVMEFVGLIPRKMEDLSVAQRCVFYKLPSLFRVTSSLIHSHRHGLFEDLCRIHEKGVRHGDIRRSNVAIPGDSEPRFIDFSHSCLHDCEGPDSCEELIEARDFLLLDECK
jgi:serine/threonine protein kinase